MQMADRKVWSHRSWRECMGRQSLMRAKRFFDFVGLTVKAFVGRPAGPCDGARAGCRLGCPVWQERRGSGRCPGLYRRAAPWPRAGFQAAGLHHGAWSSARLWCARYVWEEPPVKRLAAVRWALRWVASIMIGSARPPCPPVRRRCG